MADPVLYYSTISDVIDDSQIRPGDFGFKDDDESVPDGKTATEKLEAKVESWLKETKDVIDTHASVFSDRKRDYALEVSEEIITVIPPCIHDIAKRITINKVKQARINQDTPIVSKDDYTVQLTNDSIVSSSILNDLKACVEAYEKTTVKRRINQFVV